MDKVQHRKEVSTLPSTLEPDTLYYVRVGAGFDLYLTDHTGSHAYKINDNTEIVNVLTDNSTDKAASASTVKSLNDNKVNKSGDTMTGRLTLSTNTWEKIRFTNPDNGGYWRLEFNPNSNEKRFNIVFVNTDGSTNYIRCRAVTEPNEIILFESDLNKRLDSFGGRNLIKNSNTTQWVKWNSNNSVKITEATHRGDRLVRVDLPSASGAFGVVTPENERTISIIEGKTYTLSFYAQSTLSRLNYVYLISASKGNKILPYANIDATLGTKYSLTFTAPYTANDVGILIGVNGDFTAGGQWFAFLPPKLEEGSVATDWTPAPEDLATKSTTLAGYGITDFSVQQNLGTVDLDTIQTIGIYGQPLTANATAERHYPTTIAGSLLVIPSAYNFMQMYITFSTKEMYVRNMNSDRKTWGAWVRVDGLDKLPLSGGTVNGETTFNNNIRISGEYTLYTGTIEYQGNWLDYKTNEGHVFSLSNSQKFSVRNFFVQSKVPIECNNTMFASSFNGLPSDNNYTKATNVDGFWHDDTSNTWYFQSDAAY